MKCINGVVSWFKLTHENYLFWTRSDDRFKCGRSSWIGGDNRGFDYVSLFIMHIRQSIGSFSCSSCSFVNDDFVLHWAASIRDVFSCVLEIELQSTRVHVCAIKRSYRKDGSPGLHSTLMDLGKLVLVSWWLALWSSTFSWSRLGGNNCRRLSSFGDRLK